MAMTHVLELLLLVGPMAWFAYGYYVDFYAYGEPLRLAQVIPLLGFALYLAFVLSVGFEETKQLFSATGFRSSSRAFLMPGLGFAMAAFPYQASEWCAHYMEITRHRLNGVFRLFGWLILVFVFIGALLRGA